MITVCQFWCALSILLTLIAINCLLLILVLIHSAKLYRVLEDFEYAVTPQLTFTGPNLSKAEDNVTYIGK